MNTTTQINNLKPVITEQNLAVSKEVESKSIKGLETPTQIAAQGSQYEETASALSSSAKRKKKKSKAKLQEKVEGSSNRINQKDIAAKKAHLSCLNEKESNFLQSIVSTWQLDDSMNLFDLLGFHTYNQMEQFRKKAADRYKEPLELLQNSFFEKLTLLYATALLNASTCSIKEELRQSPFFGKIEESGKSFQSFKLQFQTICNDYAHVKLHSKTVVISSKKSELDEFDTLFSLWGKFLSQPDGLSLLVEKKLSFFGFELSEEIDPLKTIDNITSFFEYIIYFFKNSSKRTGIEYANYKTDAIDPLKPIIQKESVDKKKLVTFLKDFHAYFNQSTLTMISRADSFFQFGTDKKNNTLQATGIMAKISYPQFFCNGFLCTFMINVSRDIKRIVETRIIAPYFAKFQSQQDYINRVFDGIHFIEAELARTIPEKNNNECENANYLELTKAMREGCRKLRDKCVDRAFLKEMGNLIKDFDYDDKTMMYWTRVHIKFFPNKLFELFRLIGPKEKEILAIVKSVKEMHQKQLKLIKDFLAKQGPDFPSEIYIKDLKNIIFEENLVLARYAMILKDNFTISKYNDQISKMLDGEKFALPEEILSYLSCEGIDDLMAPESKPHESSPEEAIEVLDEGELSDFSPEEDEEKEDHDFDEKKGNPISPDLVKSKVEPVSGKIDKNLQYPSKGTYLEVRPKVMTPLEIKKITKRRKLMRILRERNFFGRSGKGSHQVYRNAHHRNVVVPQHLEARGTRHSILSSIS